MTRLKTILLINALSSGATGVLLVLLSTRVASLFGAAVRWPFVAAGIFLIIFALYVFSSARSRIISRKKVKFIIAMDVLWVIESAIIVFPQLFNLSTIGNVLIAAVAIWVALMAFLQARGLKRLSVQ